MWFREPVDLGEVASSAQYAGGARCRARAHRRSSSWWSACTRSSSPASETSPSARPDVHGTRDAHPRAHPPRGRRSRSPTSWRLALYEPDRGLLHAGWWRRPRRSRLRDQSRSRLAVRHGDRPGARRRVAPARASPIRSWWWRPAPAAAGSRPTSCAPQPACAGALRYVLVERSASLRDEQRERLALEPPDEALGPFMLADDGESPRAGARTGPDRHRARRPARRCASRGVVLANELFDNLPVHVVERAADGWLEVRVDTDGDGFVEVLVPAPPSARGRGRRRGRGCGRRRSAPGSRCRSRPAPGSSVSARCSCAARWSCSTTSTPRRSLAARGQESWMRTYRAHQRGSRSARRARAHRTSPATSRSSTSAPSPTGSGLPIREYVPQREWMGHHGIAELVAEGDAMWQEGAARGDLVAIAGPQPRRRGRRAHRPRWPRRAPGAGPAPRGLTSGLPARGAVGAGPLGPLGSDSVTGPAESAAEFDQGGPVSETIESLLDEGRTFVAVAGVRGRTRS